MTDWTYAIAVAALALAATNALGLRAVKRFVGFEEATRKWKKAIKGPRYKPKRLQEKDPEELREYDLANIREFEGVDDWLNGVYGDNAWSFQDTGVLKQEDLHGGAYRTIEVRYNQQITGWIKVIRPRWNLSGGEPVIVELDLINARQFQGSDVYGLAYTLSEIVHPAEKDTMSSREKILTEMVRVIWRVGEEAIVNPDFEVSFEGTGEWWMGYRRRVAEDMQA